jgi:hypothetical protein
MPFARLFRSAQGGLGTARLQLRGERAHFLGIGAKFG